MSSINQSALCCDMWMLSFVFRNIIKHAIDYVMCVNVWMVFIFSSIYGDS
jgi:hypothetical protein